MRTWTIAELEEISNRRFILSLIAERKNPLNPYAPLASRLNELREWVTENIPEEAHAR